MRTKHLVLIHGAWQGSWSWDAWRPELLRQGWQVHAVDLPGNGCDPRDRTMPADVTLNLYVEHVVRLLRTLDGRPWCWVTAAAASRRRR